MIERSSDLAQARTMGISGGALCLYGLFLCFSQVKRKIVGIHAVCILWIIIFTLFSFFRGTPFNSLIIYPLLCPVLFETTFLLCYASQKRMDYLRKVFWVIALYGCFLFLSSRLGQEGYNNSIYFCFLTLPWLLLGRDKKTSLLILFIFTFLAMFSLKRSVMLSMVVVWGFYVLVNIRASRNRLYFFVIFLFLIGGVFFLFDRLDQSTGGFLTERVTHEEVGTERGRLAIWEVTIHMIEKSSANQLLLGHGHLAVKRDSPLDISAHNDFLEVIYDYGLVIFLLYLCLWVYIIRRSILLFRNRSDLTIPYFSALSIFIVLSIVSHLILYASYFNFLVIFWGAIEGGLQLERKNKASRKLVK